MYKKGNIYIQFVNLMKRRGWLWKGGVWKERSGGKLLPKERWREACTKRRMHPRWLFEQWMLLGNPCNLITLDLENSFKGTNCFQIKVLANTLMYNTMWNHATNQWKRSTLVILQGDVRSSVLKTALYNKN